jgi:hypothetical protein
VKFSVPADQRQARYHQRHGDVLLGGRPAGRQQGRFAGVSAGGQVGSGVVRECYGRVSVGGYGTASRSFGKPELAGRVVVYGIGEAERDSLHAGSSRQRDCLRGRVVGAASLVIERHGTRAHGDGGRGAHLQCHRHGNGRSRARCNGDGAVIRPRGQTAEDRRIHGDGNRAGDSAACGRNYQPVSTRRGPCRGGKRRVLTRECQRLGRRRGAADLRGELQRRRRDRDIADDQRNLHLYAVRWTGEDDCGLIRSRRRGETRRIHRNGDCRWGRADCGVDLDPEGQRGSLEQDRVTRGIAGNVHLQGLRQRLSAGLRREVERGFIDADRLRGQSVGRAETQENTKDEFQVESLQGMTSSQNRTRGDA